MSINAGMPPIETIVTGKRWFRVYWEGAHPTGFTQTPLHEPPWRFSPFVDRHTGETVQALYMGDSAMGAMAETIFRKDKPGVLLPSEVDKRYICQLSNQKELKVALLTNEFLQAKLGGYNPITANDYFICNNIADMLYHLCPTALDGLVFPSYQSDAHNLNLVVFSHRAKSGDFRILPNSKTQVYGKQYKMEFLMAVDVSGRLLSDALRNKLYL